MTACPQTGGAARPTRLSDELAELLTDLERITSEAAKAKTTHDALHARRKALCVAAIDAGATITQAARAAGFTRRTVYRLIDGRNQAQT